MRPFVYSVHVFSSPGGCSLAVLVRRGLCDHADPSNGQIGVPQARQSWLSLQHGQEDDGRHGGGHHSGRSGRSRGNAQAANILAVS